LTGSFPGQSAVRRLLASYCHSKSIAQTHDKQRFLSLLVMRPKQHHENTLFEASSSLKGDAVFLHLESYRKNLTKQ
jgi:hypothetical protein